MNGNVDLLYDWNHNKMLEVELSVPDDFLLVRETLTRIGIASKKNNALIQSCHLLHKRGKYYIVHFKELFLLDGGESNLTVSDISRRNLIASLLEDWGLIKIVNHDMINMVSPLSAIKIISHKEKNDWQLIEKYTIGNKKRNRK